MTEAPRKTAPPSSPRSKHSKQQAPALPPIRPFRPHRRLFIGIGIMLLIWLGVLLFLYFHGRVITPAPAGP